MALLLAVVVLIALVEVVTHNRSTTSGSGHAFAREPYVPQLNRNAEWAGPSSGLTDQEIQKIAQNDGIEILPKFTNKFNIEAQFDDARKLAAAAKAANNPLKIFQYFSASFWFTANETGWGTYAAGFNQDWLLRDPSGNPIPFFGVGHSAEQGATPVGYLVDLANPDYRAWATQTIVSWMKAAPFNGIMFDSANQLLTGTARASVGAGLGMNFEQLLCGGSGFGSLSCQKLDDWNSGLTALVAGTSTALHKLGDEVIYNGIAANSTRGPTRNLGLLHDSAAATNEAFCMRPAAANHSRVAFLSFAEDIAIMKQIAEQDKKVIEITNYQTAAKRAFGDYCMAGFLMGWQPGSSFYMFHTGYADPLGDPYPEVPEANLALGNPQTSGYTADGGLLSRQFANGFVAVNTGKRGATVHVPYAGVQFADGIPQGKLAAGQTVHLAEHQALYLLSNKYLNGH